MQSEQLDQLFAALSAAQGEFGDVIKDKVADAGKYRYAYADLADAVHGTKAALSKNGLTVTQLIRGNSGEITLTTILGHKSGQYIGDTWQIPANGLDMQRTGGLITYARRYSHMAILGIAADNDDDARAGSASQRVNGALSPSGKRIPQGEWPTINKADPDLQINLPASKEVVDGIKPVSVRNRALVSNLVDLRAALDDEAKSGKTMTEAQRGAFADRVSAFVRDINAQLVLRDLPVMPKPETVSEAFLAARKEVSRLVAHDQSAPLADAETAEAVSA